LPDAVVFSTEHARDVALVQARRTRRVPAIGCGRNATVTRCRWTVVRLMAQPVSPCAPDVIDDVALKLVRDHGGDGVRPTAEMLMIEVDGEAASPPSAIEAASWAAHNEGLEDLHITETAEHRRALRFARNVLPPAHRTISPNKINENVVVPVDHLPALVDRITQLSAKHDVLIVSSGHTGNGSLYVNLLPRDEVGRKRSHACLADVFALVIWLEGTLSSEHGISMVKRELMPLALKAATMRLLRDVTAAFGSDRILNPGKLLP
jgi:D-lactate dehydrogenase